MRCRILKLIVAVLCFLPASAMAQDELQTDARMEGYGNKLSREDKSSAPSWILLTVLLIIGMGVLFKDAKRSHLD